MGAPSTYRPVLSKQKRGPDLLTLHHESERMMIPLNPTVAEELIGTLRDYMREFERVSLVAEVNRCKKATEDAKKAQRAAQQALSAFDGTEA